MTIAKKGHLKQNFPLLLPIMSKEKLKKDAIRRESIKRMMKTEPPKLDWKSK